MTVTECAEKGCDHNGILAVRGLDGLYCIDHFTQKRVYVMRTLREMDRLRTEYRDDVDGNNPARQPASIQ